MLHSHGWEFFWVFLRVQRGCLPDLLLVPFPRDFSSRGDWVSRGSILWARGEGSRSPRSKLQGVLWPSLEVLAYHFHFILLLKQVTKSTQIQKEENSFCLSKGRRSRSQRRRACGMGDSTATLWKIQSSTLFLQLTPCYCLNLGPCGHPSVPPNFEIRHVCELTHSQLASILLYWQVLMRSSCVTPLQSPNNIRLLIVLRFLLISLVFQT